ESRKTGRLRPLEAEEESLLEGTDMEFDAALHEERALLEQALQKLPARQRQAVALRYLADYSPDEAAGELQLGPAAFKQLLFRARRRLQTEYRRLSAGVSGIAWGAILVLRRARRATV